MLLPLAQSAEGEVRSDLVMDQVPQIAYPGTPLYLQATAHLPLYLQRQQ